MRWIKFVIPSLLIFLGMPALAATVDAVQGQVSLNRGGGFQQVVGATEAKAGDLVMASPGASARVVYSDGCTVEVRPGAVVAVGEQSPCRAGFSLGGCENADPKELSKQCPAPFAHSLLPFAVGAAIVGGAFLISTQDDDDKPRQDDDDKPRSP